MANCPGCETEIDPSFNLCPYCGVRLRDSGESGSSGSHSRESDGVTILGTHTVEHVEGQPATNVQPVGNRYVVEAEIGRGGMGVVYRARDTRLGIAVALKRLIADSAESEVAIRRFLGEGRVVAALNHVNIVRVHDVDEDEQGLYIVMELVGGQPLDQLIEAEAGPLPDDQALNLIRGIAAGLSYAHRKGVIHRDIKPANVLVTDGLVPKLVDFGLARAGRSSSISASGYGMGTFDYAAPEQKRDAKGADHRADIYALGCTFYEMLTGRKPPPHPDGVPGGFAELILKATHPDPSERYFSVDDFLRDLSRPGHRGHPRRTAFEDEPEGTCASCGTLNNTEARFCRSCGEGLFTNCPSCQEEIRAGVNHCTSCGIRPDAVSAALAHLEQASHYEIEKKLSRAVKELMAVRAEFENGRLAESDPRLDAAREALARVEGAQQKAQSLWAVGEDAYAGEDLELAASVFRQAADLDAGLEAACREQLEVIATDRSRLLTESRLKQAAQSLGDGHLDHAAQLLAEASPFEELELRREALQADLLNRKTGFDHAIEQLERAISANDLVTAREAVHAVDTGLRHYPPAGPVLDQLTNCEEACAGERKRLNEASEALAAEKLAAAEKLLGEKPGFLELQDTWNKLWEGVSGLRQSLDLHIGEARELLAAGRVAAARNAADEKDEQLQAYPPGAELLRDLEEASGRYEEQELRLQDAEWFLKAREVENALQLANEAVSFPELEEERERILARIVERQQDLDETVDRIERVIESGKLIPALTLTARRRAELRGYARGKALLATLAGKLGQAGYTLDAARAAFAEKGYERSLEILDAVGALVETESPEAAELRAEVEAAMGRRDEVLSRIASFLDQGDVQNAVNLVEYKLPGLEALRLAPDSPGRETLRRVDAARSQAGRRRRMATIRKVVLVAVLVAAAIVGGLILLKAF